MRDKQIQYISKYDSVCRKEQNNAVFIYYDWTHLMVFLGRMFIFSRALRSLCLGPSVMKPLWPSFFPLTPPLVSLMGDALNDVTKLVVAEGVVGVLEELVIVGITDKCIGSSLARGSDCSNGISEFLRILLRGEFSGVCSISLKAGNMRFMIEMLFIPFCINSTSH